MQKASFDNYAKDYDKHFTFSNIGKIQRHFVLSYLKKFLKRTTNVYELNCGTGFDAIALAPLVKKYIATDISEEMINVCTNKLKEKPLDNLTFQLSSIQTPLKAFSDSNLIFSNFGGLNCLSESELINFSKHCKDLTLNSELVLVIMSKNCLWEKFYFRLKKQPSIANRRQQTNGVPTSINGMNFITYYYSPSQIKEIFSKNYLVNEVKPIGLFVPPSYMEGFFKKHKILLDFLKLLDLFFCNFSFFANHADHYLIHLKKTN